MKLNAPIWSHDKHFLEQKQIEVVTSKDIFEMSLESPSLWKALH
jgi:predicted nucleic acid-binding protein